MKNTISLLSSPLQDLKVLHHAFNVLRKKQENNSSSDEDEPLSKYHEKTTTPEAQFLAQHVERRDAQLIHERTGKLKSSGDIPPQKDQGTEMKVGALQKPIPKVTVLQSDEEKISLSEELLAEKEKREVLCAQKIIAETKLSTLQKTLATERNQFLLLKNKMSTSEAERRELTEALKEAKKKSTMLEAMHERV